jgi:non-canonical purine NTP pyrophosphatase (RdgB/HAM1 family)
MEYFEGFYDGSIVSPRGTGGFGWDPIFQPAGSPLTFAEMSLEEKNKYSMRRIAAQKLKEYLDAKAAAPTAK